MILKKVFMSSLLLLLSISHSESMEEYLNAYLKHQMNGDDYCGNACKQQERTKTVYDSLKEYSVCDAGFVKTEQLDFVDMYSNGVITRNVFMRLLEECFVKMKSVNMLPIKEKKEKMA